MKTVIYWQIVILLFFWAWMSACGPKYTLKYQPASDMYAVFEKDQAGCEWSTDQIPNLAMLLEGHGGLSWQMAFTDCMSAKGWHKVKVFDLPIKKGYGEKGEKYYGSK